MPPVHDPIQENDFKRWYRKSKVYRRFWIPHGIDQISIVRALYRNRNYASGILLDIGCGTKKFAEIYSGRISTYWGLDLLYDELHRLHTVDVYGHATQLPFRSNSITTVLATQILGLIERPDALFDEATRVLEPGGCLI